METMKYTEDEKKLGIEFCKVISDDKELKKFFADFSGRLLKNFAVDVHRAYDNGQDREQGLQVLNDAVNKIRAITAFMHVRVISKQEAK